MSELTNMEKTWMAILIPAAFIFIYCFISLIVSWTIWGCIHALHSPHLYETPMHIENDKEKWVPSPNIKESSPAIAYPDPVKEVQ